MDAWEWGIEEEKDKNQKELEKQFAEAEAIWLLKTYPNLAERIVKKNTAADLFEAKKKNRRNG